MIHTCVYNVYHKASSGVSTKFNKFV